MSRAPQDQLDPATWPNDMRYAYEERAGIKEFEGGIARDVAEEQARVEVWEQWKREW